MEDEIRTSAEAMEAAAIPRCREVHADPKRCRGGEDVVEGVELEPSRDFFAASAALSGRLRFSAAPSET